MGRVRRVGRVGADRHARSYLPYPPYLPYLPTLPTNVPPRPITGHTPLADATANVATRSTVAIYENTEAGMRLA